MKLKTSERKQSSVLNVLILFGFASLISLAIDGGRAYLIRHNAQQAAAAAARAGALAMARGQDFTLAANSAAARDGYDNDGADDTVIVNHPPGEGCAGSTDPSTGNSDYVQVIIQSDFRTYIVRVVGILEVHTCVEAIEEVSPSAHSFSESNETYAVREKVHKVHSTAQLLVD